MKNEEYAELIREVEAEAQNDGAAMRRSTIAWALGGYAFILGLLFAVVGLLAGCGWLLFATHRFPAGLLKIMAVLVFAAFGILRALWIRFDEPEGRLVTREEAPALHEEVEKLRRALDTPQIHRILATSDLNASLTQTPRLGPIGFYRNTLSVGLPLMEAMPASEFRAVLAHELGHASRAHGRMGAWIYRLMATFSRLHQHFEESKGVFDGVVKNFLDWWWPRFQARASVLRRRHEYEADEFASRIESASALVRGLARLQVVGDRLSGFWTDIRRLTRAQVTPPEDLIERMRPFLAGADDQDADRLVRAWAAEPSISDSHPSLKQRGRALGVREFGIDALASTEKNAAEFFFGTSARTVVSDLSTKWREETAPVWALAYAQSLSENDRLKELESTDEAAMSVEQTVERAIFAEEREGADAALGWLERALARDPESAPALFHAGRLRLARGEEAAIDLLRRASGVETFRGGALSLIEGFLRERGRVAELSAVEKELWAHGDMMEAAAAERSALSESDPIEAHGLDEAGVARWRAIVKDRSDIEAAYLHRKAMRHLASDAYYVLAVQVKIPWNRRSEPITNKVLAELVTMTPDKGWVVILNGASKSYREGMALESARIF